MASKIKPVRFLSEEGKAVPIKNIDKVMNIGRRAVCRVDTKTQCQGTGALYEVEQPGSDSHSFLFMTCNHVLPSSSREEVCAATLDFHDLSDMRYVTLEHEHVRHVWTVRHLDATVVEFSSQLAEQFKRKNARFLKIGMAKAKMEVALLQYPDGVFSFAHGDVDEVSGNDVHYRFGTASGSSGSPLLNWAAQAVAMHKLGEAPRSATSTPAASLLSSASASLSSASSTPKLSPTPTPTASPSQTLTQVPTTQQPDLQRTASLLSVVVEAYFRERPTSISVPNEVAILRSEKARLLTENARLRASLPPSAAASSSSSGIDASDSSSATTEAPAALAASRELMQPLENSHEQPREQPRPFQSPGELELEEEAEVEEEQVALAPVPGRMPTESSGNSRNVGSERSSVGSAGALHNEPQSLITSSSTSSQQGNLAIYASSGAKSLGMSGLLANQSPSPSSSNASPVPGAGAAGGATKISMASIAVRRQQSQQVSEMRRADRPAAAARAAKGSTPPAAAAAASASTPTPTSIPAPSAAAPPSAPPANAPPAPAASAPLGAGTFYQNANFLNLVAAHAQQDPYRTIYMNKDFIAAQQQDPQLAFPTIYMNKEFLEAQALMQRQQPQPSPQPAAPVANSRQRPVSGNDTPGAARASGQASHGGLTSLAGAGGPARVERLISEPATSTGAPSGSLTPATIAISGLSASGVEDPFVTAFMGTPGLESPLAEAPEEYLEMEGGEAQAAPGVRVGEVLVDQLLEPEPEPEQVDADVLVEDVPEKIWEDENEESLVTTLEEWAPSGFGSGSGGYQDADEEGADEMADDPCTLTRHKRIGPTCVRCTLHTTARKLEALLAQGELCMKAYGVSVRVRPAPALPASRVVLVTGFEDVDVEFVRGREGVLRARCTSNKFHGGAIESIETLDERGVPFARVTFQNAADAANIVQYAKANAIVFVKGIKLTLELEEAEREYRPPSPAPPPPEPEPPAAPQPPSLSSAKPVAAPVAEEDALQEQVPSVAQPMPKVTYAPPASEMPTIYMNAAAVPKSAPTGQPQPKLAAYKRPLPPLPPPASKPAATHTQPAPVAAPLFAAPKFVRTLEEDDNNDSGPSSISLPAPTPVAPVASVPSLPPAPASSSTPTPAPVTSRSSTSQAQAAASGFAGTGSALRGARDMSPPHVEVEVEEEEEDTSANFLLEGLPARGALTDDELNVRLLSLAASVGDQCRLVHRTPAGERALVHFSRPKPKTVFVNFVESLMLHVSSYGARQVTADALARTHMLAVYGIEAAAVPTLVQQVEDALRSRWTALGLTSREPLASSQFVGEPLPALLLLIFKDSRDVSAVLAKQSQIAPLAPLLAVEYYVELGALLPVDSILPLPSVVPPASPGAMAGPAGRGAQQLALHVPAALPEELAAFLLKFPHELDELKRHLKRAAGLEFDCRKTGQNTLVASVALGVLLERARAGCRLGETASAWRAPGLDDRQRESVGKELSEFLHRLMVPVPTDVYDIIYEFARGTLSQGEPLEVESNREWSTIDLVGREIVVERAKARLEEHMQEVEQQRELFSLAASGAPGTSGGNVNRAAAMPRNTSDIRTGDGNVSLPSSSASAAAARPPTAQAQPQSLTPAATAPAASSRAGAKQSGARAAGGRGPSTGALPPSSFKPTHSETIELLIYQHIFLKCYERFLDDYRNDRVRITFLAGEKRLRIEGTPDTVRKAKADIQSGLFAKFKLGRSVEPEPLAMLLETPEVRNKIQEALEMTGVVCAFESIDKQFPDGRTKVVIQFVAFESEDIKNTIETVAQMVGHESVEIPAHLLEQFKSVEARDTLKEHLEEKFGRVVLDFQESVLIVYALRVCSQPAEHLSSVKRDVEMWLEGEISDKVEVDLGTGDLDTAVLRFLARNCPDKVQYLEREYQMKITERSMIFTGKPSQAEIAGEALRNVLSTLIKHPLIITDPVHVRWFALEALRQPVLDRIETNTHSAIQVQQMPTIRGSAAASATGPSDNASIVPSGDGNVSSNEQVKLVIYSNSNDNLKLADETLQSMLVDAVELRVITGEDALKLESKQHPLYGGEAYKAAETGPAQIQQPQVMPQQTTLEMQAPVLGYAGGYACGLV